MFKTLRFLFLFSLVTIFANLSANAENSPAPIFNVKAFGAKGDGVHDDAPALKAALDATQRSNRQNITATIFIPKGIYSLATAYGERQMFSCKGLNNVIIEGEEGATFLVRDPIRGFFDVSDSSNVTFKRIAIDYSPLTFTQFKVFDNGKETAKGKEFTLELMSGFPDPASPHLEKGNSIIAYKSDGTMNLEAPLLKLVSLERQANGHYRAVLAGWHGNPDFVCAGDFLVKNGRHFGRSAFRFSQVNNPTLEKVKVFAGPEVFLLAVECENLHVTDCRIAPPEGSDRLLSTSADGIFHVGGHQGPTVTGCYFNGNGDDSINIHQTGGCFYGFSSNNELIVTETPWTTHNDAYVPHWRRGEHFELLNARFETVLKAVITDFKVEQRGSFDVLRVKFKLEPDIFVDSKLIASLPESTKIYKDYIGFNTDRCGGNFVIKGNTFTNHRARGILIQSRHGIINENNFSLLDGGIMLIGEWHEKDGPMAQDITIIGNDFKNLGRHISDGAISLRVPNCRTREFSQIRIEANHFTNGRDPAIYIDNASDVIIRNNRIVYGPWSTPQAELSIGTGGPTQNIEIKDNQIIPAAK